MFTQVSARLSSFGFMLFNLSVVGLKESSLVLLFSLCFSFEIIFLYSYARLLLSFSKYAKISAIRDEVEEGSERESIVERAVHGPVHQTSRIR